MKTQLFYIAIAAVLSLSTLNASAEGTKGKKVCAVKKNTSVSHLLNGVKEVEMEMESWMTSLGEFKLSSDIVSEEPFQFVGAVGAMAQEGNKVETFKENEIKVENKVLNNFNENKETKNIQDDGFILEGWMLESSGIKTQEMFTDVEF